MGLGICLRNDFVGYKIYACYLPDPPYLAILLHLFFQHVASYLFPRPKIPLLTFAAASASFSSEHLSLSAVISDF